MRALLRLVLLLAPLAAASAAPKNGEEFINTGWMFHRGDVAGRAWAQPSYDASGWAPTEVPHDWSADDLPPRAADASSPVLAVRAGTWKFYAGKGNAGFADPALDADETAYADALADTTRGLVAALPAKKVSDPKSSVFSIACYSHHASEKAKFADERALDSNASQADALFMFLQPSVTTSLKYVDGGAGGFATC